MEDPTMESVTFLYNLTEGICDKSYGFYTAKMAGLDDKVSQNNSIQINSILFRLYEKHSMHQKC